MPHWKKAFPSRYLQVSDLEDGPLVATIKRVSAENVGTGDDAELKLVVHFEESSIKSLVLNLTRAEAIESLAGNPDTEQWPGTRVQLVRGQTRYQGKKVGCITVEAPPTRARASAVTQPNEHDEAPF
jgi:hypothetical protein